MDNNFNEYKKMKSNSMSTNDKIQDIKNMLLDSEKCKEIAQKITNYINSNTQ